ncbi:MAG TPA: OsmC family protein [Opitutaceae bacterium]|jgi:uncharacterized OsmC-like protein
MVTITGEYEGELHCRSAHGPSGSVLATDAPKDNQGRGGAFSPTDLVATGYATCIATTMAIVARRHGAELGRIRFEVTKEMTADAPRRIARLRARFWMPAGADAVPRDVLDAAARGCPVHLSLSPAIEKSIELIWP